MAVIDKLNLSIPWDKKVLAQSIIDGDILLTRGNVISKNDIAKYPGKYPIYSSSIHDNGLFGSYGKYMFDEELISWSVDGGGNLFYRPKHKFSITNVSGILKIKKNFYYKYLHYLLSRQHSFTQFDYMGKAHPSVIDKMYYVFDVSVNEQRRIAEILSTIDEAIDSTQALIDKHEQIKEGMMHDLFTRGVDPATGSLRPHPSDAPELYKDSELGLIPKEWEVDKLIGVSGMKSGDGITSKNIDESGDYIVYGGNGVRGYTKSYNHEGYYILIGRQGALCGNINFVHGAFFASEHAVVVYPYDFINTTWLGNKLILMNLNQYSESSAQPGLAVGNILNLKISYPHKVEQDIIESIILKNEQHINSLNQKKQKLLLQKQGLMQDLLSGKVRVI